MKKIKLGKGRKIHYSEDGKTALCGRGNTTVLEPDGSLQIKTSEATEVLELELLHPQEG